MINVSAGLIILLLTFVQSLVFGQDRMIKDLDNDQIKDTVFINTDSSRIIYKLSTQHFREIRSKVIDFSDETYFNYAGKCEELYQKNKGAL